MSAFGLLSSCHVATFPFVHCVVAELGGLSMRCRPYIACLFGGLAVVLLARPDWGWGGCFYRRRGVAKQPYIYSYSDPANVLVDIPENHHTGELLQCLVEGSEGALRV